MVALKLVGAVLAGALFRCRRAAPLLHTPLASGSQNSTSMPLWGALFQASATLLLI
jgi:hypothetical protein